MNGKEVDIIKEVAKEAYSDGAKPIIKPTGELFGLLPRAIKAACLPLEKWILTKEFNLAETQKLLEEKLKDISPENIETPEPYIAVPALQYISYCMDNTELRDMYANLLANSMNKVIRNGVHPGFVEIIKQLCPDEAKILKSIYRYQSIPVITIKYKLKQGEVDIIKNFSIIGEETKCENPYETNKYFNNLERLGLVEKPILSSFTDKSKYIPLREHPYIIINLEIPEEMKVEPIGFQSPRIDEGIINITDYGISFCKICMGVVK